MVKMNMKKKLIIVPVVLIAALLAVFLIFNGFSKKHGEYNYIALGDSIAEGMDAFSNIGDGYTDYVKDYLEDEGKLNFYTKGFSKSGYTTDDVKNDIENNKKIEVDGKGIYIKEALRESDLVTLTIGANNFIKGVNLLNMADKISDIGAAKKEADQIASEVKDLIVLIKQYAKKQIIVTGYFNPFPYLTAQKETIDEIVKYFNNLVEEICEELEVDYVNIFDILDGNTKALPNPVNIHPSLEGYKLIAQEVIKKINS